MSDFLNAIAGLLFLFTLWGVTTGRTLLVVVVLGGVGLSATLKSFISNKLASGAYRTVGELSEEELASVLGRAWDKNRVTSCGRYLFGTKKGDLYLIRRSNDKKKWVGRYRFGWGKKARLLRRIYREVLEQEEVRGKDNNYLTQYGQQMKSLGEATEPMSLVDFRKKLTVIRDVFRLAEGDLDGKLKKLCNKAHLRIAEIQAKLAEIQDHLEESKIRARNAGEARSSHYEELHQGFEEEIIDARRNGMIIAMKIMATVIVFKGIKKALQKQHEVWHKADDRLREEEELLDSQQKLHEARAFNRKAGKFANEGIDQEIAEVSPLLLGLVKQAFDVLDLQFTNESFYFLNQTSFDDEYHIDSIMELKDIERKVLQQENDLVDISYLVNIEESITEDSYTEAISTALSAIEDVNLDLPL